MECVSGEPGFTQTHERRCCVRRATTGTASRATISHDHARLVAKQARHQRYRASGAAGRVDAQSELLADRRVGEAGGLSLPIETESGH